jgi:hypothetical protein
MDTPNIEDCVTFPLVYLFNSKGIIVDKGYGIKHGNDFKNHMGA